MPDNLSAALWYATKLNWAVVPVNIRMPDGSCSCSLGKRCTSIGKHPTTQHGALDATTDKGQIRDWWRDFPDASVGVACGEINNLIVIDVDPRNEGDIALEVERSKHGSVWLKTLTAETGGGGHHYFYKYTDKPLRKAPKGIDFKSSGFVVVAPSMHPSGKQYRWLIPPRTTQQLRTFPKWATESQRERSKDGVSFTQVMVEGERDNELTRRAGKYRRIGMTEAAMYRALSADNEMFCEPPLDDRDVRRIARSIARKNPAGDDRVDVSVDEYNELGYARRMARAYAGELYYINSGWTRWGSERWEHLSDDAFAYPYAWSVGDILRQEAEDIKDEKERKRVLDKATQTGNHRTVVSILNQAKSLMRKSINDFDANHLLFNVHEGTLDDGVIREHRREDFITKISPTHYDPNAEAPRFYQFLQETFGNDRRFIDYIQRLFGYCMTGDMSEQAFFIFWGTGGNGKTLLIETIRYVMGKDYTGTIDSGNLFREKFNNSAVFNAFAALPGKRLAIATESERKSIDESLIKRITGGDPLTGKFLYHDPFEFYPQFKVILVTNNRPSISGASDAMKRRIQFIPFESKPAVVDKQLFEKLRAESSGILNWLIDGMIMWQEQGLNPPARVLRATRKYRESEDIIGQFIYDCCVLDVKSSVTINDLYTVYVNWCATERTRPRGKITFNQAIEDRKIAQKIRRQYGWVWKGMHVREL